MKKFFLISCIGLLMAADALACAGGTYSHNYYLFSVFCRESIEKPMFSDRLDKFWEDYTNGEVKQWKWHADDIYAYAKRKGDAEMLRYLDELNKYLDISDQLGESWSYPTKEELQARKQALSSMIAKADAYKGKRLRNQWMLLRMRANMVMGNHQYNIDYWERTASKAADAGVYRDMMQNIYAGALMKTGKRLKACNLFAEQGDMLSLKWAMRKYRNLAGIKVIYNEDANMPSLNYLVQDFVNNSQETLDQIRENNTGDWNAAEDAEWMQSIDARTILKQEGQQFMAFAGKVLAERKTASPALWKAAIGELLYLYGDNDAAYNTLTEAMTMNGTQRMKDNARAIRIVASVGSEHFFQNDYQPWLIEEMKWLEKMRKEEPGYYNHYGEVIERLIYEELVPRYEKTGQKNLSAALIALAVRSRANWDKEAIANESVEEYEDNWNYNYSDDYYAILNRMTGDELVKFYQWLTRKSEGALEAWAKQSMDISEEYYYDLIGTHYIAEGRFADAIGYLEKVSPKFMEGQNISFLLANRDYTKPRWSGRQAFMKGVNTEGAHLATLTKNPKLEFCKEMVELEKQLKKARKDKRAKVAYDLATRYYQASSWGDCWYLSHYGWSCMDTVATNEKDFIKTTIALLNESKQSKDAKLKMESLYALAFIPLDQWAEEKYDWQTDKYYYIPNKSSRQYQALQTFVDFQQANNLPMLAYMSKCDVLKRFRD